MWSSCKKVEKSFLLSTRNFNDDFMKQEPTRVPFLTSETKVGGVDSNFLCNYSYIHASVISLVLMYFSCESEKKG